MLESSEPFELRRAARLRALEPWDVKNFPEPANDGERFDLVDAEGFIYTIQPLSFAAYRKDLGNVRPTVLSSYRVTWNAEELFLKK